MVKNRFPVENPESPSILGEAITFKTSNRVARNRFMKSAMSELISSYNNDLKISGIPTQRVINIYEKFGNGGFGVLITGNISICHNHIEAPGCMAISIEGDSKESRLQFKRLADVGKSGRSLLIGQLNHCGRQTFEHVNPRPFAASEIPLKVKMKGGIFGRPIALTVEQIKTEVIDRFVFAAQRLYEAGFDGVEIHAGNGFMLSNFLSPTTNNRTDMYGGSVENRVRIVEEVYRAIRGEIPAKTGFIVGIKLNSVEFQEGGSDQQDIIEIAKSVDRLGFDFIELTGGTYEKMQFWHATESTLPREAFFIEFAATVRPHIKSSVVYLTGGFRTVPAMVKAVRNKETDGISLARPVAAEPDLPRKIFNWGIQSAALTQFENDFSLGLSAAQTQLAQMGSSDLKDSNGDLCFGISDFSDEAEANAFTKGAIDWYGKMMNGVFEYKTRSKDIYGGLKNIPKTAQSNL